MVRRKRTGVEYFGPQIGRFSSLISDCHGKAGKCFCAIPLLKYGEADRAHPHNKVDDKIQFVLKKRT
jgi:hypothetical protein